MMKKKINGEIFNKYFGCKNPSFLAKDLIKTDQSKINEMVNQTIESINKIRSSIIKEEIPENQNPNKITDVVEKIVEFNNQQKGTGFKISTTKQIL